MSEEQKHFICIGERCWGRSKDEDVALFKCISNLSGSKDADYKYQFVTFEVPEGAYVNEMGGINYDPSLGEPKKIKVAHVVSKDVRKFQEYWCYVSEPEDITYFDE